MASSSAYPVQLDIDSPLEVARWRPLVQWFLAIPHFIVLSVMNGVQEVLFVVSFFAILFTGNIPAGIFDFMATILRYQWRGSSYSPVLPPPPPPLPLSSPPPPPRAHPAPV